MLNKLLILSCIFLTFAKSIEEFLQIQLKPGDSSRLLA